MGPAFHRRQAGKFTVRGTALAVCAVGLVALVIQIHQRSGSGGGVQNTSMLARLGVAPSSSSGASSGCCRYVRPLPFMEDRDALGRVLEAEGLKTGIELGVQRGAYSQTLLTQWTKCKHYILVDIWGQQENYDDIANVSDQEQEAILKEAHSRLDPFLKRGTSVEFMRMLTSEAAAKIPDRSLDFVYVDARHDYCGVAEDIELYWPKLREGGIMAGHDYVLAASWEKMGQDWTLCGDGSRKPLAVVGAVNDFAAKHDLQVVVPPFDWEFKSWVIRKPVTQCGGSGAQAVEAALAADS